MFNALTIDVEDYYMVSAFSDIVRFEDWNKFESRVDKNTHAILDLLDVYSVKATFFVLGWVAEHNPELVKEIDRRGHELASHGYNHRLIYELTPDEFRDDTRKSKKIIEDISGKPVIGYRATSFSITEKSIWSLDIISEEGFLYDSSIFPIRHDKYGMPNAKRFPHRISLHANSIIEFPMSTFKLMGYQVPVAGGGYLRLYPWWFTDLAIRSINEKEKQPAIVYLHPWEMDAEQPRINGRLLSKVRHCLNLKSTMPKLKNILEEFEFRTVSFLAEQIGAGLK